MIIDLFAGPGGWSTGLRMIDTHTPMLGFELDDAACDTAEAAGHRRHRGDVTMLDPGSFGPATGLIASPPCPGFSAAGKGLGRKDLQLIIDALPSCDIDMVRMLENDHRSSLTLEPLRWVNVLEPDWVALEQVPAVLPVWKTYADHLGSRGYSTWAGLVQAEQFGVPQTRKRAVMLASRSRAVAAPVPSHSKYYPRTPDRLDDGVLPWVSMAEAIQQGLLARPSPTITGGGTDTGGAEPIAHLSRYAKDWVVRSNYGTGGDPSNRVEQPSATVTGKVGRNMWVERTHMGDVYNTHGCVRPVEAPSPTITASADNGNFRWLQGNQKPNGDMYQQRSMDAPAQTVTTNARSYRWTRNRPSTTVMGDPRISAPGRHDPTVPGSQQNDSIRVTVQEAGVLQSFPADYPWRGTKSRQYQQVGNAVPPLLAAALLAVVLP